MYRLRQTIAAIAFDITVDRPFEKLSSGGIHPEFTNEVVRPDLEVSIRGHYREELSLSLDESELVFQNGINWEVYRHDGKLVFALRLPNTPSTPPIRIAVFRPDFLDGDVYHLLPPKRDWLLFPAPLEHPFYFMLMVSLLAQGHGVLIHACGIDDDGKGLLFTGSSGRGKSTTARLWEGEGAVLSDERVVLRQYDGRLWIFGTPWHGDYEKYAPHGVPLEKIFLLHHGPSNRIVPMPPIATAAELVSHCFLPAWDSTGTEFVLDFCGQVAATIPCYSLEFTPDKSVIDFVRSQP